MTSSCVGAADCGLNCHCAPPRLLFFGTQLAHPLRPVAESQSAGSQEFATRPAQTQKRYISASGSKLCSLVSFSLSWDLRDTAATPKAASTQESRGGIHNYANTPFPEAPELKPAEVRHHREHSSYLSSRGSRTSADRRRSGQIGGLGRLVSPSSMP